MKWTTHLSRIQAELAPDQWPVEDVALIAIHDRSRSPPDHRSVPEARGWRDVIYLAFDDVTGHIPGYVAPSADDARKIVDFIEQHRDRPIVAHCEAGISRSAAVCRLLQDLGWEYQQPHDLGLSLANRLLYSHLRNVLVVGGVLHQGTA
jgi:predicted protein tyrosine phosphatase